ncbi:SDR family NAD(P)-dependent oxidoreductase [Pendulispora albinea]|uniref:SDR family NAD(P)-dependent oxidoreductase n=1 Tax=Pendulispora albinea TaxID=2741071 RepID=A0ABZ2LQK3_9BACT
MTIDELRRVAVVTGTSRGLGYAIAKLLAARANMHVVATSTELESGRRAIARLAGEGLPITHHLLDVTDPASVAALGHHVRERFGRIDVLVNNAAVFPTFLEPEEGSVLTARPETVLSTFNVNAVGALRLAQTFVPLMREQGHGRVVNVSSEVASLAVLPEDEYPLSPSYRISKVGMNALTRLLARELRGTDVLVNTYSPGWMRTDMGGPDAPFSAEEGAETAFYLATLPRGGPQGGFFAEMRKFGGPIALPW